MRWTTEKRYLVFKTQKGIYHWERSENMYIYDDFDSLTPILYTNAMNIAIQTAINLNKYHEQRQAI